MGYIYFKLEVEHYQAHDILILLTAVDCGTLTNLANAQVSHTAGTTLGQTATSSCDTGYNLVRGGTRTCQDTGVWSGSEPICQRMLLPTCMCLCAQGFYLTYLSTYVVTNLHVFMCTSIWSICKSNGRFHSLCTSSICLSLSLTPRPSKGKDGTPVNKCQVSSQVDESKSLPCTNLLILTCLVPRPLQNGKHTKRLLISHCFETLCA